MKPSVEELKEIARQVRIETIKAIYLAGSGHPGGSLSVTDILVTLYFGGYVNVDPNNPYKPDRDRVVLSKGHAAPALYAVLALKGFDEIYSPFYWEDCDLAIRALEAGYQLLYLPESRVYHQSSSTISTYRSHNRRRLVSNKRVATNCRAGGTINFLGLAAIKRPRSSVQAAI